LGGILAAIVHFGEKRHNGNRKKRSEQIHY